MTEREREIYEILKVDPLIQQNELADRLGITRSSVAVHISNLIKKGYIKGKGYVLSNLKHGVVVIGGANVDITGFSRDLIIEGDSNPGIVETSMGGVGRNIAENLGRLDVDTRLISVVGKDSYGDRVLDEGKKAGIDMNLVSRSQENQTSVYLQILDDEKDLKIAISDMAIAEEISLTMINRYNNHLSNAKVIVADGNLSEDVIDHLVEEYGYKLFFDTVSVKKSSKIKKHFGKINTIKPNKKEVETILNIVIDSDEKIEEALWMFKNKGVKNPIISLGEAGVAFLDGETVKYQNPILGDLKSTTGAGDAFMAGLVYSFIKDLSLEDSVKTATALSSLTVESKMAVNPKISVKSLEERMEAL